MHYSQTKQVKVRSPIHGTLHELQAMYLPFNLTLAPRVFQRRPNRTFIILEIPRKLTYLTERARMCILHPAVKRFALTLSKHACKALAQLKELLKLSMERTHFRQRRDIQRTAI